jgi:hypothetical protein
LEKGHTHRAIFKCQAYWIGELFLAALGKIDAFNTVGAEFLLSALGKLPAEAAAIYAAAPNHWEFE